MPAQLSPEHAAYLRSLTEYDDTTTCRLEWSINRWDPDEREVCGEPAIACDVQSEEGRCGAHLNEFAWLEAWGFLPEHKTPFQLLDHQVSSTSPWD